MRSVVLLLLSASLMFAPPTADQDVYVLQDGTKCGPTGVGTSVVGKDLNRHKNRFLAPAEDKIDPEVRSPPCSRPASIVLDSIRRRGCASALLSWM